MSKKVLLISLCVFILNIFLGYFIFRIIEDKNVKPIIKTKTSNVESGLVNNTSILIGGDVMLGRSVYKKASDLNDYSYPFGKISDLTKSADIFFVNLESPFAENCPFYTEGYVFCADQKMSEALISSGVDIVNLSNNHIRNFGQSGVEFTKKVLLNKNIAFTGLGGFEIIETKGIKYGFLGFDFTVNDITDSDVDLIKKSDKEVDVLIIHVHWGDEYKAIHNAKQERLAKIIIASGADLIAGSHPHWVQDIEIIDNVPVFYSLGNLVFDQMWSEETKKGLMVKLNFENGKIVDYQRIAIYIDELGKPVLK